SRVLRLLKRRVVVVVVVDAGCGTAKASKFDDRRAMGWNGSIRFDSIRFDFGVGTRSALSAVCRGSDVKVDTLLRRHARVALLFLSPDAVVVVVRSAMACGDGDGNMAQLSGDVSGAAASALWRRRRAHAR